MQLYHHKGVLAALSAHECVCSFTTTWECMQLYQHQGVCEASSAQEYRWSFTMKGQVGHYLHTCTSYLSTTIMNTTFHAQHRSTIFMHWNRTSSGASKEKKQCILNCLTLSTDSHWDRTNMLNKKTDTCTNQLLHIYRNSMSNSWTVSTKFVMGKKEEVLTHY